MNHQELAETRHDNELCVDIVIRLSNYGADDVDPADIAREAGWTLEKTDEVLRRCIMLGDLEAA